MTDIDGREAVAVASDHAGYELKEVIKPTLVELGYAVQDLGTHGPESVDYPAYGKTMADAIARGELSVGYYQHRLPIDPATYPRVAGHHLEQLTAVLGTDHEQLVELQSLLTAFGHLPPDPFLGSWNVGRLFPVACSCWLVIAVL